MIPSFLAYDQAMRLLAVIVFLVAALPQPLAAQVYEAAVTANKRGDYRQKSY